MTTPNCGPWSSSNTNRTPEDLALVRQNEITALEFTREAFKIQATPGDDYLTEQTLASEPLRQPALAFSNFNDIQTDGYTDMCPHGWKHPENNLPNKMPMILRGSEKL